MGFILFRHMVQELLNIEYFCQKNSTKSKLNFFIRELECTLGIVGKPLMSGIS
jgi:hypothetical protein